jgi:uncharacterized protein YhbP (UPF0306 family)
MKILIPLKLQKLCNPLKPESMSTIPHTILQFLHSQTCATICGINAEQVPSCFNCFYAIDETNGYLLFKSKSESCHSQWLRFHPIIAGTVLPDTLNVLNIQGVQWEGRVIEATATIARNAWKCYHKRHPAALLIPGNIWIIQLEKIKMTSGSKPLGKKLNWVRGKADYMLI